MKNSKEGISEKRIFTLLFLLVLFVAGFLRFAFLQDQGFIDTDEYAGFAFLQREVPIYQLKGVAGSMWGRPFGFLVTYFFMLILGVTPETMLFRSAVFGLATVILVYFIGERHFGKHVGLFSSALMATLFSMVFYSRNMKHISPSLFFCALAIWFLVPAMRSSKSSRYLLCGLSLGFMVTTHPNTLPLAAVVLVLLAFKALYNIIKDESFKGKKEILMRALLAPLGLFLPMLACELFFVVARYLLPFLEIDNSVGYLRNLLYHGSLPQENAPTISFYLEGIGVNGDVFVWGTVVIGFWLLTSRERFRHAGFILTSLFWGPIVIYVLSDVVAVRRNVISVVLPACLIWGIGLSALTTWLVGFFNKNALKIILPIAVIGVLVPGFMGSVTCIQKMSAAQQIADHIQVGRASITRPSRSVYYWINYYFLERNLFVDTWADVLRNFLSRRAEFLVPLREGHTQAEELLDPQYPPTHKFRLLTSSGRELDYGMYDFRKAPHIFEEKFGFVLMDRLDTPSVLVLSHHSESSLARNLSEFSTRFKIERFSGGNLLMVSGRLPLHEPGEMLTVALGNAEKESLYSLEFFQTKTAKTSIHRVWRLPDMFPEDIYLSLILTGKKGRPYKPNLQLENFEVGFYRLPKEHLDLAQECPVLRENPENNEKYNQMLRRFSDDFNPETPLKFEGGFIGKKQIKSSQYKPNTRYKVRFKARTDWKTPGRVGVMLRDGSGIYQDLKRKHFWGPLWLGYQFEFTTPVTPALLILYTENIRGLNPNKHVYLEKLELFEVLP